MGASGWTHLDVTLVKRDTSDDNGRGGALLLVLAKNGRELWVPRSVISDVDDYSAGDRNCTVSVQDWWAEKNKLS